MKQKLLFIACLFVMAGNLFGQKQISEGKVVMELTDISSDDPQTAAMMEMMKGSQTIINFNKTGHASKMSMMGGMVEVKTYVNNENKMFDMLMDMMGQKFWIQSSLDELSKGEEAKQAQNAKVEYNKESTKKIMGYNCYAMTVTMPDNPDLKLTGFVTEDIKTDANIIQGMQAIKFAGFPIEYTLTTPMVKMTMTAVEIKETADASDLTAQTGGYTKMTMDEFKKKMGGMGGFGF